MSGGAASVAWPPFDPEALRREVKRLGPPGKETVRRNPNRQTSYSDRHYSYHRPVGEKLCRQLYFALLQGVNSIEDEIHRRFCISERLSDKYTITEIPSKEGKIGIALAIGSRSQMEDNASYHDLTLCDEVAQLVMVCDGHDDEGKAGEEVRRRLPVDLQGLSSLERETILNFLVDRMVEYNQVSSRGTTVLGALIFQTHVFVFNVGDCRAVLCKPGKILQVTEDAVPENPRFSRSIAKAGHEIDGGYVGGDISVGRDVGNSFVSPRPKITEVQRGPQSDQLATMKIYAPSGSYLILASDGFFGWASNPKVYEAVAEMAQRHFNPQQMATNLVNGALVNKSTDNVSVAVIRLD